MTSGVKNSTAISVINLINQAEENIFSNRVDSNFDLTNERNCFESLASAKNGSAHNEVLIALNHLSTQ